MSAPRKVCVITPTVIASLQPLLLRQAMRLVGQREAAEDVVQDTWISALRSVDAFEGRSALSTWLIGIMRHRVFDLHRRNRRRTQSIEETDWISDTRIPEALDARMQVEAIEQHADELTGLQQAAIKLCAVDEHDRDEAAAMLNVSRGHLRVLLHRGRAHLRATTGT